MTQQAYVWQKLKTILVVASSQFCQHNAKAHSNCQWCFISSGHKQTDSGRSFFTAAKFLQSSSED
ncbi:hypothetical protein F2Q69_00009249 [Brassica cretica]|uniref:Secreted protein n=2 Tax=Brassica cretica TaxID=69181 RepID=A0ABQ7CD47_BRACR|nr:hypothetical protein F2Q69_00009249 [Brassica cretica]KAF3549713.1 hypothetical protein DY000_02009691 [Brassica cretica]